jgi:hypothetical protein
MHENIAFDVRGYYYLPHYTPIAGELTRRGAGCVYVIYRSRQADLQALLEAAVTEQSLNAHWVDGEDEALRYYQSRVPDWVCFANDFSRLDELPERTRTAQFWHGVGPKMIYYDKNLAQMNVRFVEGDHRLRRLKEMYPQANFVQTGYAKLDPLFKSEIHPFELAGHGLDPRRPTLLYAPTYYPSSLELFPDDWPAQFSAYNLIIKPHYFSWVGEKYQAQRIKLKRWAKASNVYVTRIQEDSLLPFMLAADLLISEASSSLFEFAALDKPIIWCDFLKLRWTYRGPLRYRYSRRMDPEMKQFSHVGAHARKYAELLGVVEAQIRRPETYAASRASCTRALVGPTDGGASARIADYMLGSRHAAIGAHLQS